VNCCHIKLIFVSERQLQFLVEEINFSTEINYISDARNSVSTAYNAFDGGHTDKIRYKSPEPDGRVGFYLSVSRRRWHRGRACFVGIFRRPVIKKEKKISKSYDTVRGLAKRQEDISRRGSCGAFGV